jgi:hypothetical protein
MNGGHNDMSVRVALDALARRVQREGMIARGARALRWCAMRCAARTDNARAVKPAQGRRAYFDKCDKLDISDEASTASESPDASSRSRSSTMRAGAP